MLPLFFRRVLPLAIFMLSAGLARSQNPLNGTVLDPNGAAVPDCALRLETTRGTVLQRTVTDEHGHFRLKMNAAGDYTVTVPTAHGFSEARVPVHFGSSPVSALEVHLKLEEVLQAVEVASDSPSVRSVFVNDLALQVLTAMGISERKRKKDRGVLFPGVTPEQLSMRFIRACRDAGVEDFSFHDLRHTYASHLRMKGADLDDIRRLLGHSDLRMTIRYTHLGQSHLDAAASRLDGVLTLPAQIEEA